MATRKIKYKIELCAYRSTLSLAEGPLDETSNLAVSNSAKRARRAFFSLKLPLFVGFKHTPRRAKQDEKNRMTKRAKQLSTHSASRKHRPHPAPSRHCRKNHTSRQTRVGIITKKHIVNPGGRAHTTARGLFAGVRDPPDPGTHLELWISAEA